MHKVPKKGNKKKEFQTDIGSLRAGNGPADSCGDYRWGIISFYFIFFSFSFLDTRFLYLKEQNSI